jgi:hypothetical protein
MITRLAYANRSAASSALVVDISPPAEAVATPPASAEPKAPKSTLAKERFMALLIAIERMKPLRPSSAANDDQNVVVDRKSRGDGSEAGIRIQQRHDHRHVRAADRQDKEDPDEHGDRQHRGENPHFIWRDDQPTQADAARGEQHQIHGILPAKGQGSTRQDFLQLAERHEASGDGEPTEQHLQPQRMDLPLSKRPGGRTVRVFADAHQGSCQRAERVAQSDPLRHRGHRHPHAEWVSRDCAHGGADSDPFIGYDAAVKEGRDDGDRHAKGGKLHPTPCAVRTTERAKRGDEQERCE